MGSQRVGCWSPPSAQDELGRLGLGTTVVSVTRVLWFCVASQTSQRKEPEIESHHHGRCCSSESRGSHVTRETWGSTLRSQHTQESKSTHVLSGQQELGKEKH